MQKVKLKVLVIIILTISVSCKSTILKEMNFGEFKGRVPISWTKIKMQGIDSSVTGIRISDKDTIFMDYGPYSNPFNDIIEVRSLERKALYDSVQFKYPENMVFTDDAEIDYSQGLYLKEYYYYEEVDGRKAKLGFPKKEKNGYCLLHIKKVDNKGNKLSIYVENVNRNLEKDIYSFFKSIKFKEKLSD